MLLIVKSKVTTLSHPAALVRICVAVLLLLVYVIPSIHVKLSQATCKSVAVMIGQQFPSPKPKSPKEPLEIIVPLTSVISQLNSDVQEPVTQLFKEILLPLDAKNDILFKNPLLTVAPLMIVSPFNNKSTELPLQPSPKLSYKFRL